MGFLPNAIKIILTNWESTAVKTFTDRHTISGAKEKDLYCGTIRSAKYVTTPPHPTPPRPVPAPHAPDYQPGIAHGTQLNANVARGDTKIYGP